MPNPLRTELDALIAQYRRDLQPKLVKMQELFAAGRLKELRRALHTLAGSAATFGLPKVGDAARAAEEYLAAGGGKELGSLLRRIEEQARKK